MAADGEKPMAIDSRYRNCRAGSVINIGVLKSAASQRRCRRIDRILALRARRERAHLRVGAQSVAMIDKLH